MKKNRTIAFDSKSMRSEEWNGHLRVDSTNLTKANICEYYGFEISGYDQLGLDPKKKYRLLRSPEELKKAVESFAERPILYVHKASDADTYDSSKNIGTTGSNPVFETPFIKNSITIWDGDYIEKIKDGTQKELSASYQYKPVMQSGEYEGEPYDGIMTDIYVDHIALVEKGRAGPDVRVADSKTILKESKSMSKLNKLGVRLAIDLCALLNKGLATDSVGNDIATIVGFASGNKRKSIAEMISLGLRMRSIANDEDTDRIEETVEKAMDEDCKAKDNDPVDTLEAKDNDPDLDKKEPSKGNDEDEDKDKNKTKVTTGNDSEGEQTPSKEPEQTRSNASDAALIEARIAHRFEQAADARDAVKPLVGNWGRASDSAENIYISALAEHRVKAPKGTPIAALKLLVEQQVQMKNTKQSIANDSQVKQSDLERIGAFHMIGQ